MNLRESKHRYHTILAEGARPAVLRSEQERAVVEAHVGHCVVRWGHIDLWLTMALPTWEKAAGKISSQRSVAGLVVSEKLKRFKAVLPAGWADGERLISELGASWDYRNALAHWPLGISAVIEGESSPSWGVWSHYKGRPRISLDTSAMDHQSTAVDVLYQAVISVMGEAFVGRPATELVGVSLARAVIDAPGTWHTREDHLRFQRRASEMFPEN